MFSIFTISSAFKNYKNSEILYTCAITGTETGWSWNQFHWTNSYRVVYSVDISLQPRDDTMV